jgi:hypothetical protein
MSELTVEQIIERGKEARRFLESPVFRDVILDCKATFTQSWLDSEDEKTHFASWASIHALAEIEAALMRVANEGVMTEHKLKKN